MKNARGDAGFFVADGVADCANENARVSAGICFCSGLSFIR
jgi:hypothetical protein